MKTIYRNIVGALIFYKDHGLFMGMKDPTRGGVYADCWHIPGGGVDDGETNLEALQRELKEETGIEVNVASLNLIDDSGEGESIKTLNGETVLCKMRFFVYQVELNLSAENVDIQLCDDLVKYEWVNKGDLDKYKLTPPSMKLFKRIGLI